MLVPFTDAGKATDLLPRHSCGWNALPDEIRQGIWCYVLAGVRLHRLPQYPTTRSTGQYLADSAETIPCRYLRVAKGFVSNVEIHYAVLTASELQINDPRHLHWLCKKLIDKGTRSIRSFAVETTGSLETRSPRLLKTILLSFPNRQRWANLQTITLDFGKTSEEQHPIPHLKVAFMIMQGYQLRDMGVDEDCLNIPCEYSNDDEISRYLRRQALVPLDHLLCGDTFRRQQDILDVLLPYARDNGIEVVLRWRVLFGINRSRGLPHTIAVRS